MAKKISPPYSRKLTFSEHCTSNRAIKLWLQGENSPEVDEGSVNTINTWKGQSPAHAKAIDELEDFLESPELSLALDSVDQGVVPAPSKTAEFKSWSWKIAAAIALIFVIPFEFSDFSVQFSDQRTFVGEQRVIKLDDGSSIFLNTDSAVDIDFDAHSRQVRLIKGEALFDVTQDPDRPFTIDMQHGKLTVVGTRFTAKTAGDNDEAFVLEGKVWTEAYKSSSNSKRILKAQDFANINSTGKISVEKKLASPDWAQGRLVFNGTPLSDVVTEIDRYLPGAIFIAKSEFKKKRLTATYSLDKLETAPEIIADTMDLDIQRLGPLTVLY